jgi:hypothetical protein
MTFAFLTIHPVKMDGIPIPGSSRGLPTGEMDKTRFIHACGSDGYTRLDARTGRSKQAQAVADHLHRLRSIRKYAGFEIHDGEIRKSLCVAAYKITEYRADGVSYEPLPLSAACPT